MKEKKCADCRNFIQHYGLDNRQFYKVYCGHCMRPGAKHKRPDTKVCEYFVPGSKDTSAFVTKEYLSKELLKYVLSLELLPKIKEMSEVIENK